MMPARYELLAAWANEFGWTRGAELGVSDGRTFLYLLEHCPALMMIGVDVWDLPGIVPGKTVSGEKCRCQYCAQTKADRGRTTVQQREQMATSGAARFRRSILYKMPTIAAAAHVDGGSLDFVFVDGDHSTEGVSGDIVVWRPKLKPGGRMCGHDINMAAVRDGVLEHYPPTEISVEDDHVWWASP